MRTVDDLFQQYVREFRLPEYFGWNWAAFDECMTDLAWMPANGYLTVIDSADQVLADELDDRATSLRHLRGIGRYWSRAFALGPAWGRGEVAFHTVLVDSDDVGTVGD
ncbi:barstar family protein [Kribbella sp. NPDC048928]|uniref:barstar family protein n=1 Tax=Kribbella sp. NPDC048928 TaxID=3364111 RepID=UPI003716EB60